MPPITPLAEQLLSNPSCVAMAPVIYALWADGELTDEELHAIDTQTSAATLDAQTRATLHAWLNPDVPPTATELSRLLRGVRTKLAAADLGDVLSFAELGGALAGRALVPAEQHALEELTLSLGLQPRRLASLFRADSQATALITDNAWRQLEQAPAFDVSAMTNVLDGKYAQARRGLRALLSAPSFRYQYEADKAAQRAQVLSWLRALAAERLGEKAFPDVLKKSQDLGEFVALFETLGHFDLSLSIKFGVQFGLFGGSLYFLGTDKHHALLQDVADCKILGCFAMSELGHGSNVRDILTTASYDAATSEWVIHTPTEMARKEWIGNAALHGQMATVFAQLHLGDDEHGVHAFLVPIRDAQGQPMPGVHIADCGEKAGLNGVDSGRLWFDQVRIPRDYLLNRYADVSPDGIYTSPIASPSKRFFTMLGTLVGGRVSVGGISLSASKSALSIAVRYGAMRRQFGPVGERESTLLNFRAHQRRLMPLLANAYALTFGQRYVVERFVGRTETDGREVEALAAGFKAYASWNATHTIQTARECCGGQGYLTINRLPALKADSDIFTTFEGDNTVLMQLVAKSLMTDYGKQFSELSFGSVMRFLSGSADELLNKLDPITSRRTEPEHLRDAEVQLELMRLRERSLVASLTKRFKKRLDSKMDAFDATSELQDHMLSAANAHIERVLLERFCEAVEACSSPDLAAQLQTLRALFGLQHIEQDLSWFIENSLIEAPKAKAIREQVNTLCAEVRQQAVHLCDAFAIPDELLAAPIAKSPVVEPRSV